MVPGPVRLRQPVHPAGRARLERRQGQGRRPDQERLRCLHAPLGPGRDDAMVYGSTRGRAPSTPTAARSNSTSTACLLHPGRLRPVPAVQGGIRPGQGAGGQGQRGQGQGGEGQGRQGQAQGQGRGGQDRGAEEGPRLRARRPGPAQDPPDHPLGRHRRHGPVQERREALLPGPLREGLRPVDDGNPDARHQALFQAGRQPDRDGDGGRRQGAVRRRRRPGREDRPRERQVRARGRRRARWSSTRPPRKPICTTTCGGR